jgi:integrase
MCAKKQRGVTVSLKGVHEIRRKLADGSVKSYFYAWRGGPRLDPDHPEGLLGSYAELVKRKRDGSLMTQAIDRFQLSTEHQKRKDLWRHECEAIHERIRAEFGTYDISLFTDRRSRGVVRQWRDSMASSPRQADKVVSELVAILNWLYDGGEMEAHCIGNIGKIGKSADRSGIVWEPAEIDAVCAHLMPESANVVRLAVLTGLDLGDLITLQWSEVGKVDIMTDRNKTKQRAVIPIMAEAKTILSELPKRSTSVLTNSKGTPFTADGFKTVFQRAKKKATEQFPAIAGKTFKDLRGTACTRFMIAFPAMTDSDLDEVMGWSPGGARKLRRVYVDREKVTTAMIARIKK